MNYGFTKKVNTGFDETIEKVTAVLKEEGFGVLTTIDVKETLKKKLDVDYDRYTILGACNPPFAYEALQAEDTIGLLMPCNVIIQEKSDGVNVMVFNPEVISAVSDKEELKDLSKKLSEKIQKVLTHL